MSQFHSTVESTLHWPRQSSHLFAGPHRNSYSSVPENILPKLGRVEWSQSILKAASHSTPNSAIPVSLDVNIRFQYHCTLHAHSYDGPTDGACYCCAKFFLKLLPPRKLEPSFFLDAERLCSLGVASCGFDGARHGIGRGAKWISDECPRHEG